MEPWQRVQTMSSQSIRREAPVEQSEDVRRLPEMFVLHGIQVGGSCQFCWDWTFQSVAMETQRRQLCAQTQSFSGEVAVQVALSSANDPSSVAPPPPMQQTRELGESKLSSEGMLPSNWWSRSNDASCTNDPSSVGMVPCKMLLSRFKIQQNKFGSQAQFIEDGPFEKVEIKTQTRELRQETKFSRDAAIRVVSFEFQIPELGEPSQLRGNVAIHILFGRSNLVVLVGSSSWPKAVTVGS